MQTQDLESQIRNALAASPTVVALGAVDDVPLAFNVALPDQPFGNGHISIRFDELAVTAPACAIACTPRDDGRGVAATLRWPTMTLTGAYAVNAIAMPVVTLDTGGTMLDDADVDVEDDIEPGGASPTGAPVEPLDPATRNAMLDNARAQRTRLMDQPNGQALMGSYDEHNETYNTVFVTSAAARQAWNANGATKAMALDTHVSVGANGVVNDPAKTYGPTNVPYNNNAFNQQLQIVVNTMAADLSFNMYDPNAKPDPASPYTKASLAALTFGKAVGQTGNSKAATVPLAPDKIFHAVNGGSAPPAATVDELMNVLNQGASSGGAAAAAEASARGWRVLDEEDRAHVRRYLRAAALQRAEQLARPRCVLWSGACGAELLDVEAEVELAIGDDGGVRIVACRVRLPAFAFHIDDAAWTGDAAVIARQRLARLYFIRSLVQDHVKSGLDRFVTARLAHLAS